MYRSIKTQGVELVGPAPRVECRVHGVVVSRVPWAEPGIRFTRWNARG